MLQWNREGYGFRMRTITPSSIKNEPLDVLRRGLPVPQRPLHHESRGVAGVPTSSAIYAEGVRTRDFVAYDRASGQAVPLLLRENIREYENIVDTIVQRTREQERIVREWDIEMERLTEIQYRMYYDDVVREFNHKVREYCLQKLNFISGF
jgi:hypothetical protein